MADRFANGSQDKCVYDIFLKSNVPIAGVLNAICSRLDHITECVQGGVGDIEINRGGLNIGFANGCIRATVDPNPVHVSEEWMNAPMGEPKPPLRSTKAANMLWGYFFGRFRPNDVMENPTEHDYFAIMECLREEEK